MTMTILNLYLGSIKSAGSLLHCKFKCTRQEVLTQAASDAHIHAPSGTCTRRDGLCAQVLLSCCDRDCYPQLPGATEHAQSRVSKHVGSVAQGGNNESCLQESEGPKDESSPNHSSIMKLADNIRGSHLKSAGELKELELPVCHKVRFEVSTKEMSHPTLSFCMS